MTDGRKNGGGGRKWKIVQYSARIVTAETEDDHGIDVTAASGAAILCLKLKV